ncbi:hypothetical protein SCLCIDRAFT_1214505 [Scleroderma citrinum Foug A]|uniref:Uncharacterized protein n=1 Tax=Scleroderma citrinum Foug A TaxID=1036808 RepID=A0A0C3DQN0_9AGAM|nr:hypothetical protein SCLCIDRAFT_1214505 [Scleroderma citrinum Foug A]
MSNPCATSADALQKFPPSLDFHQRGDADADRTCESLAAFLFEYPKEWQPPFGGTRCKTPLALT